jgi:IclR family pca regulon transcriptional regulator
VYVLRVPTHKIMSINLSIGSRLPAYCTSMGRVLLAGLDDARVDTVLDASELVSRTSRTLVDKCELKQHIAQVRKQGWAIVDQELEEGLISLSAPIHDRHGRVIAAMNISGNAQRQSARQMIKTFLDPLQAAARRVSDMVARRG